MKLQLHVNGYLFKELRLPRGDFMDNEKMNYRQNVECRKERLEDYIQFMEAKYFREIDKSREWKIYLIAESKVGKMIVI